MQTNSSTGARLRLLGLKGPPRRARHHFYNLTIYIGLFPPNGPQLKEQSQHEVFRLQAEVSPGTPLGIPSQRHSVFSAFRAKRKNHPWSVTSTVAFEVPEWVLFWGTS